MKFEARRFVEVGGERLAFAEACRRSGLRYDTVLARVLTQGLSMEEALVYRRGPRPLENFRHGGAMGGKKTPEYRAWGAMRQRCRNPKHKKWKFYGGKGHDVLYPSFEAFLGEVGCKPTPRHTIDRIDNDKGYEPGNCRWATPEEQRLNQRRRNGPVVEHAESRAGRRRTHAKGAGDLDAGGVGERIDGEGEVRE
jgi:hypothetical protein